jgi:hypothetical protein
MTQGTKKTLIVIGGICLIFGIACLAFGNSILIGAPIIGALTTFAGFIMLVLGTRKEDDLNPAKPVEAAKTVEVTKKAA